jgi:cell division protein FtsL
MSCENYSIESRINSIEENQKNLLERMEREKKREKRRKEKIEEEKREEKERKEKEREKQIKENTRNINSTIGFTFFVCVMASILLFWNIFLTQKLYNLDSNIDEVRAKIFQPKESSNPIAEQILVVDEEVVTPN